MRRTLIAIFGLCFCHVFADDGSSFSYQKFRGPVSGQIYEVTVPGYHSNRLDYVAKPDYLYTYGVEDPENGHSQAHRETRNGDEVKGEYKVLQADGILRIVQYTADRENGFRATVRYVKP